MQAPADPLAVMRTKQYAFVLVLAGILGVPISIVAYFFLWLISHSQTWIYKDLPTGLGFSSQPMWWPIPCLLVAGVAVGAAIHYLPGTGGHSPADGFKAGGGPALPSELPGIFLAAIASLALGAVIGPEAPLIALGGGLAVLILYVSKRDQPQAIAVIGAAGSFAAVAVLMGSPLIAAFLFLEAVGLAGEMALLVLMPGLLAAGIGALVAVGLNSITGLGEVSFAIPNLPAFAHPTGGQFLWAIGIGVLAAILGSSVRRFALELRPHVDKQIMIMTPIAGLVVALIAVGYSEITGKGTADILFSGQNDLPNLVAHAGAYTVSTLVLLVVAKSLAYGVSLSSFRGGPIFPAMFIGSAGGILLSHLPGLPLVPAMGMGLGAMMCVMLRLPMTSVLVASLVLGTDAIPAIPLVIVAVVVAFLVANVISPPPPKDDSASTGKKPAAAPAATAAQPAGG